MLNDALLTIGATAMKNAVTFLQLHSAAPNAGYTTNVIGTRVAVSGTVDADGDITFGPTNFTGLPASGPVTHGSYWSASTAGVNYGGALIPVGGVNDPTANAAGEYTFTVTETSTAS